MHKFRTIGLLLLAGIVLCAAPAVEARLHLRLQLNTNELVVAGAEEFDGEAFLLSQGPLRMNGTAVRDIWMFSMAGKPVEVGPTARLQGDARFAALSGTFAGSASGNVMALLYGAFHLTPEGKIGGDLAVRGGTLVCEGAVKGDAILIGETVTLGGSWGGRVQVQAQEIRVEPGTIFGGDLEYACPVPVTLDASVQLAGKLAPRDYLFDFLAPKSRAQTLNERLYLAGQRFFGSLMVGVLALWLFPGFIGLSTWNIRAMPFRVVFTGMVLFFMIPGFAFFAMLLFGGIPLALMIGAFYFSLLYLSQVVFAIWLGGMVLAALKKKTLVFSSLFLGLFLVHLALAFAAMLPFLAEMVMAGCVLLGFGAMNVALFSRPPFPAKFMRRAPPQNPSEPENENPQPPEA